ncbi:MAG: PolC-type DNA polymerase III [bacterium]|nr:PolC-type DNA polymerase III [bacterium]
MLFFESFDQFEVNNKLGELFQFVEVTKVAVKQAEQVILVYIDSENIIPHQYVKTMELLMQKKLFPDWEIQIREHYNLKHENEFATVMRRYKDTLGEEIKDKSVIGAYYINNEKYEITGNTITFEMEDNFINKTYFKVMESFLVEAFDQRFGLSIEVKVNYFAPVVKEEKEDDYQELMLHHKQELAKRDAEHAAHKEEHGEHAQPKEQPKRVEPKNASANTSGGGGGGFKSNFGDKKQYTPKKKLPNDPNVVYGRNFEGKTVSIVDIQDEIGEIVVHGKIVSTEERELRNGKTLLMFSLTDFTDSITVKIFINKEDTERVVGKLKQGTFILLKGMALYDSYSKEISISSVVGVKTISDFTVKRKDEAVEKRVELHCHTVMSDMDAVVNVKPLIKRALEWGHPAIAITDHGVVQSFPEASHAIGKDDPIKIIYGMEGYIVDDTKLIVENDKGQEIDSPCVVFDIETTGFDSSINHIIEIGAVKVVKGIVVDRYSTFINPGVRIPARITELTSITDEDVKDARTIEEILPEFLSFCEGCTLVAHNASFDVGFITYKAKLMGIDIDFTVLDTVSLARLLLPRLSKFKLNLVAKELGISLENHHRAVDDAEATAGIFLRFVDMLKEQNVATFAQLNEKNRLTPEGIKKLPTNHIIILAKNDIGRVNLYRLVSLSHIDYFSRRPRIPKSLLTKYREGLILGSACEAGEVFQALVRNQPEPEIKRLVDYYDYLEVQPLGNNEFMIESDRYEVSSKDDLIEFNRRIIELGERYHKPVVATCDCHFIDPEDEVYRRVIMAGKGFKDADNQPPLYFRTTDEMLKEFDYLGAAKAREIVITNTNKIADMIDNISPVRPDKCPPVIEDSDKTLREICYTKAESMYGPNLPEQVKTRLEHELNSIISNGFAVMYIIAQKLVWKSNEDGYLVGSRGSVGSSFVATMAGITEVNPLAAHYYCTNCFYSDFTSEEVRQYAGSSGCDMPDKLCPNCGQPLSKDGHDIPFETFLGFYGDKEPDIDLNFSGEYQAKAHDYTEVIFGKGQTFRAGTIGTLAEKTAFGFVKNYYEEHGEKKRNAEIDRIVSGCVGVRRTTGQHPGGIIVLPLGEEIYSFTPVQRPANDMHTQTVTTHFDYHSIDHNLLKLDILGHDDPTMIRMLEDLTGIDALSIRFDDEKVLSLFESTEALGIEPKDLVDCNLGSLGIPEFGTDFVMQMLRDTKPKTFSDLVRISGLSHGTDVWLNNAQYFIANGNCTLSTAICTRDDIMTFLIYKGVENGLAFKIMESVRKGKGLKPDMEEAMKAANVEDWYIESCKRIKYMFPKAHAAAYVMMAFRIAYFKVYQPLAYYAAYFSIRASAFNYELMCLGQSRLEQHMKDYKKRSNELTKKEQDTYKDMRCVQEMYARGFEFLPIDIYKSDSKNFQIIDGKLLPPFSTIDGLGDKAAEAVVEAVKDGVFMSQNDFKTRTKVSQSVIDLMVDLDILSHLPESDQLSIFDIF